MTRKAIGKQLTYLRRALNAVDGKLSLGKSLTTRQMKQISNIRLLPCIMSGSLSGVIKRVCHVAFLFSEQLSGLLHTLHDGHVKGALRFAAATADTLTCMMLKCIVMSL